MGRTRKEELTGEAKELAEDYNKRIAELQKKKAEALKRLKEKTEKLNIKLLKRFITDVNEICSACACDKKTLSAITSLIKEHKEELASYLQEEDGSLKKENPRDEGSDVKDMEITDISSGTENTDGSDGII